MPIGFARGRRNSASGEGDGALPNIFSGVRGGVRPSEEGDGPKASMAELLAEFKHAKQEKALQMGYRQQEEDSMKRRASVAAAQGGAASAPPSKLSAAYPVSLPRMQSKAAKRTMMAHTSPPRQSAEVVASTAPTALLAAAAEPPHGAPSAQQQQQQQQQQQHEPRPPPHPRPPEASVIRAKPSPRGGKHASKAPTRRCAGAVAFGGERQPGGSSSNYSPGMAHGHGVSFSTVVPPMA